MDKQAKIYIAGQGLVGSALMRALQAEGYTNLITRSFAELDLRNQAAVHDFFNQEKPEYVFLAAAKVGGIKANNDFPASFIYDNLMIEANIIHASYTNGVKKLLFLGSSCIYPRNCPQPIQEEYLMTDELEKTNEPYALAKIAGILLCKSYNRQYGTKFISCMPTNLYGPHDNFDFESSHVIPALIAKIHAAKEENKPSVSLWGTGKALREFLYVDDLAQACLFLMNSYEESGHINIGTGKDITIAELASLIKEIVGYAGEILFNINTLDGTPRKVLNVDKISQLGWTAKTSLKNGLKEAYFWYLAHKVVPEKSYKQARV
ncbi:MAG: GDP-L-fucose synthase family protein [Candidatus Babeliales bacterium]